MSSTSFGAPAHDDKSIVRSVKRLKFARRSLVTFIEPQSAGSAKATSRGPPPMVAAMYCRPSTR